MDTPSISSTSCCLKTPLSSENCTANQEVFAFHNYSKEAFSTSPKTALNRAELSSDMENSGSSQFSLTVASSPEPLIENENGKNCFLDENQDKLTESDIEDSENISSTNDPPTEDENSESVFQDFNIIKIEEESIPVSKNQSEMKHISTSFGSFVEEHSDAIITQQLNKDKMGGSSESSDPSKQTKTTLRILQLPEGKQPVLLRTTDNHFAMPVPIKARPGFKLITNSANPQINVSYMKPGFEGSTNTPGVTLTQKSKRIEVSAPRVETVEKQVVVQTGVTATSNHFLINSPGLKGPVLLSSTAHNNPTDKIAKTQPTCYLVQRSIPFTQASSTPSLRLAGTQLPLNSRPVLAMPVTSADKPSTLQTGRQAFLLRYISQNKSSLLLSNQESKKGSQCSQTSESSGNKVLFKIVTPAGNLLTSGTPTSGSQSLFLATRPQTQCYLLSSNKTNTIVPDSVKKMITIKNTSQKVVKESCITPPHFTANVKPSESEKLILAPRPIRPPSERKRRKKTLFDELPSTAYKARRLSNKVLTEKDTSVLWKPVAKEVVRTLRLSPFNSLQHIKCPRRYQPVVVLNHPDADIPEVSNIMNVVSRYRGAVSKVSLSLKTIQALSNAQEKSLTKGASLQSNDSRPRPVQSFVRERFLLKLKLRKKSKKKYEVVQTLSDCGHEPVVFDCWFCGRLFNSQEDWIGHGQRHLMEATRDWNKLF
ncbi:zinc finger protein 518A [Aulostomus maculatus]